MRVYTLVVAFLFLTGCITNYTGPTPELDKRGAAAEAEYRKFKIWDGFLQAEYHLIMGEGGNEQGYFTSSLKPTITKVSPDAWKTLEETKVWRHVAWLTLAAAAGIFISAVSDGDGKFFSYDQSVAYYSLLGISLGSSITRSYYVSYAAEQYNKDLRQKLSPGVSLNYSFE